MKISEQLLQCAAEVKRGWCQGALINSDGKVCALGAMGLVLFGDAKTEGSRLMLSEYMWRALCHYNIVAWNNAPDQTQENVAQTFELAAILAEQDEARIGVSETMAASAETMEVVQ